MTVSQSLFIFDQMCVCEICYFLSPSPIAGLLSLISPSPRIDLLFFLGPLEEADNQLRGLNLQSSASISVGLTWPNREFHSRSMPMCLLLNSFASLIWEWVFIQMQQELQLCHGGTTQNDLQLVLFQHEWLYFQTLKCSERDKCFPLCLLESRVFVVWQETRAKPAIALASIISLDVIDHMKRTSLFLLYSGWLYFLTVLPKI